MGHERTDDYEVVVVGGGAAGLNGALMLARSRRSVLVIDEGRPRNAPAQAIHGLLGHDGLAPAALLERGRDEVRSYGGEIRRGAVTAARAEGGGFLLTLDDGSRVRAQRLLVASGASDVLPGVPGLAERWGRDVLHCPYCHGWEVQDQAIGVLAISAAPAVHQALLFRQLCDDVVVFAHEASFDDEQRALLTARGIEILEGDVVGVDVHDDRLAAIRLADGSAVPRAALVVATRVEARLGPLRGLGLQPVEAFEGLVEHLVVDQTGRTAAEGIWAAGNVAEPMLQVGAAAAAGAVAGAQINADLVMEQAQSALAASES